MMSSAPRWAVHQALAERVPATYAARQAPAQGLGISPDMEDTAIAYGLLTEVSIDLPGSGVLLVTESAKDSSRADYISKRKKAATEWRRQHSIH